MNETTRVAGGGPPREERMGEAPPWPGAADTSLFGFAEAARVMLWSVEGTRMMLELNRTLLDIGQDMLRRQQDAAIATALQAFGAAGGGGAASPGRAAAPDAVSDLVRQSFDAFDRMMAAMRAANMAALRAANEGSAAAAAGGPPPDTEGRTASRQDAS
jgi:hypothetical protein